MLERWLHREEVPALHRRDIEQVLKDLGLLDQIKAGSIVCIKCGLPLRIDNIQCLFMDNNTIKLCCSNIDCYKSILIDRGTKKHE